VWSAVRYIALSKEERITLGELFKNHWNARQRMRAHALLLSDRRFKIKDIANIYLVDRDTVSSWFDHWEQLGIVGLQDDLRPGRPQKLGAEEQVRVRQLFEVHARSLKTIVGEILKETGKQVSTDTLKRIGRKGKLLWKRVRISLRAKRDPLAFAQAQEELQALHLSHTKGEIDLYFFDAAGFSLTPCGPYAWQPVGEYIEGPVAKSRRLNVLGFLSPQQPLTSFVFEGTIDSQVIVACFNEFCKTLTKPTWVVIDNAPVHTSDTFAEQRGEWEAKGLFIKYLPPYAPELNRIEILWRFIKYRWLPFTAYGSYEKLKEAVEEILANFGGKYHITFA
jgi:transposase